GYESSAPCGSGVGSHSSGSSRLSAARSIGPWPADAFNEKVRDMSIVELFYFWPSNPAASIFTLWILSQIFLYAARVPMHRALREVGRLLGGAFRIGARWC